MKNFLFGLIAIATALSASAFTNAPEKTSLTTRYWTNDGTNYTLFTSGVPNTASKCTANSTVQCAIQSENGSIPDSFPITDLGLYPHSNVPGSTVARYVP